MQDEADVQNRPCSKIQKLFLSWNHLLLSIFDCLFKQLTKCSSFIKFTHGQVKSNSRFSPHIQANGLRTKKAPLIKGQMILGDLAGNGNQIILFVPEFPVFFHQAAADKPGDKNYPQPARHRQLSDIHRILLSGLLHQPDKNTCCALVGLEGYFSSIISFHMFLD